MLFPPIGHIRPLTGELLLRSSSRLRLRGSQPPLLVDAGGADSQRDGRYRGSNPRLPPPQTDGLPPAPPGPHFPRQADRSRPCLLSYLKSIAIPPRCRLRSGVSSMRRVRDAMFCRCRADQAPWSRSSSSCSCLYLRSILKKTLN